MKSIKYSTDGFTLIELMLAMSIFSLVFILTTVGFIGINRTYTRGAIKKDLAESVQRVADTVSTIVPSESVLCLNTLGDGGCGDSRAPYDLLCGEDNDVRFFWKDKTYPDAGGLYYDFKGCGQVIRESSAQQILDDRFVVESLHLDHLDAYSSSGHDLKRLWGVFRTADKNAFTISNDNSTYDPTDPLYSPEKLRCKGSSAGSIVQTCAIQKFDIVVSKDQKEDSP